MTTMRLTPRDPSALLDVGPGAIAGPDGVACGRPGRAGTGLQDEREQPGREAVEEDGLVRAKPSHWIAVISARISGWRVIDSMTLLKIIPMPIPAPTAPSPPPSAIASERKPGLSGVGQ
jgi:hypothetical protein